MKKMITLCLSGLCLFSVSAQEITGHYLFPEFEYARILYKNGAIAKGLVNYDLSIHKMVFVDTADSLVKELGDMDKIGAIRTEERTFRIVGKEKIQEVLLADPMLVVEYNAKKKDQGKMGAYGTRSQIAAIDNHLVGHMDKISERKDQERWVISGFERFYQVEKNHKMKRFSTIKQFLKIYPRENRDAINAFIQENNISLESTTQVVALCKFAASLD